MTFTNDPDFEAAWSARWSECKGLRPKDLTEEAWRLIRRSDFQAGWDAAFDHMQENAAEAA